MSTNCSQRSEDSQSSYERERKASDNIVSLLSWTRQMLHTSSVVCPGSFSSWTLLSGFPELLWAGSLPLLAQCVQLDQELINAFSTSTHERLGSPVQPRIRMIERADPDADSTIMSRMTPYTLALLSVDRPLVHARIVRAGDGCVCS